MRRFVITALLLMVLACSLAAEDTIVREARNINWNGMHVRTLDNCEILLWEDTRGGDQDIWAQKINASGQTLWAEPLPIAMKPGRQTIVGVVPSSDNNFILLWEDGEYNMPNTLWIQKFTSNGQTLWPEMGIPVTSESAYYYKSKLVANTVGGAYVFFRSVMGVTPLRGQNLDAWGNQLWQAGGMDVHNLSSYFNIDSAVADGSGGAIVCLNIAQAGSHLIHVSPTGSAIGNNPMLPPSAFPGDYSIMPGINGEFILHSNLESGGAVLSLQKMNANGDLLLPNIVHTGIGAVSNYYDHIGLAPTSQGGIIIIWKEYTYPDINLLKIQKLDSSFAPLWMAGGITVTTVPNLDISRHRVSIHA
ncbi:MAG: hypothetical protein U1B83_10280, partial [Candidatus Cloacimonadaceae bacterium]|nr:hypothetical protein [Candidatus Cloacimonadaceae bacterium]